MGLIARQLEAAGIPTVSLSSAYDITRAVNPPRAVYLDYPLGHTSGRVEQAELNRDIVHHALTAFHELQEPGSMIHLPYRWSESDDWKDGVMRSKTSSKGGVETEDDRVARLPTPQYQLESDAEAAAASHDGQTCLVCAGVDY